MDDQQIRLERRSSAYWRVVFDMPPLNIFGPRHMAPLTAVVAALETDKDVKVVVFDRTVALAAYSLALAMSIRPSRLKSPSATVRLPEPAAKP